MAGQAFMLGYYLYREFLIRVVGVAARGTKARLIIDLIVIAIGYSDVVDGIVSVNVICN